MRSTSVWPLQFHAVVLAAFASIIAPFGGFFASGFKRGFKIKDFGDSIPGHGGMTDRMDCQVSCCTAFSALHSLQHRNCRYVKCRIHCSPTASNLCWCLPRSCFFSFFVKLRQLACIPAHSLSGVQQCITPNLKQAYVQALDCHKTSCTGIPAYMCVKCLSAGLADCHGDVRLFILQQLCCSADTCSGRGLDLHAAIGPRPAA